MDKLFFYDKKNFFSFSKFSFIFPFQKTSIKLIQFYVINPRFHNQIINSFITYNINN
jgi:hypothetical protein